MGLKVTAFTKKRCWFFHRWAVAWTTGFTTYSTCDDCGSRKIEQPDGGHQPINTEWLLGIVNNKQKEKTP